MVSESGTWVAQHSGFFWGVKSGLVDINVNSPKDLRCQH